MNFADQIAIAVCSRGLIHSRTMKAIERERYAIGDCDLEIEDEFPIPDAQNSIVARLLDRLQKPRIEWILFVEEDIVLPPNLFASFDQSPIQAVNYRLPGGTEAIRRNRFGSVLFCGLGCTLIARKVFESMPRPYFETDWQYTEENDRLQRTGKGGNQYGGLDIDFCYKATAAGFQIREVPDITAGHLRVSEMGTPGVNAGLHRIIEL